MLKKCVELVICPWHNLDVTINGINKRFIVSFDSAVSDLNMTPGVSCSIPHSTNSVFSRKQPYMDTCSMCYCRLTAVLSRTVRLRLKAPSPDGGHVAPTTPGPNCWGEINVCFCKPNFIKTFENHSFMD